MDPKDQEIASNPVIHTNQSLLRQTSGKVIVWTSSALSVACGMLPIGVASWSTWMWWKSMSAPLKVEFS